MFTGGEYDILSKYGMQSWMTEVEIMCLAAKKSNFIYKFVEAILSDLAATEVI